MRLAFASLALLTVACSPALAQQIDLKRHIVKPVYQGAPMTPIPIDYTGPCGASYRCVNGTQLNCTRNSRPAEFLKPYRCFCEFASTCR
jgi:hypothetical protein